MVKIVTVTAIFKNIQATFSSGCYNPVEMAESASKAI